MKIALHRWWLAWLVSLSTALAADMLPLCPTSPQFFPQKLPMHCRMPRSVDESDFPQFPTLPPLPESYFRSLPPHRRAPPIPVPIPPFPGMPGAMPMPGPMGGPMPPPMPGPMGGPMPPPMPGMPGGMPMPMPVPMVGGPPHKLPVIVMPFYSQDHSIKKLRKVKPRRRRKKKKHRYSTETESCSWEESSDSDSSSSSEHGYWTGRRNARKNMAMRSNRPHKHNMRRKLKNKKKDILTPILQYVTKEGYVIFEKKISKSEAKDWLKELKPQTEMTEFKEEIHEVKPETKPAEKQPEEYRFDPKSAEDFFRIDEEEKRLKAMEINKISKEVAPIEVTTRKGKRKHRPLKFNPLVENNE